MIYFTADTHFGDERLGLMGRQYCVNNKGDTCKTAADFAEFMLHNMNSVGIKKSDYLFFNGDVCYTPEFLPYLAKLPNCKRCLIRGNHDRQFDDSTMGKYFDSIIDEGKGVELLISDIRCYVTHYPTQARTHQFNLVGHIHGVWKVQLNMLNVGIDVHGFHPIDEERVRFYFEAIKKFYDEDVWVGYKDVNSEYLGVRGKKGRYFQ